MAQGDETPTPKAGKMILVLLVFIQWILTWVSPAENGNSTPEVKKKVVRTDEEVKAMSAKEYMDEMIVPNLMKALSAVNKTVSQKPILKFFSCLME